MSIDYRQDSDNATMRFRRLRILVITAAAVAIAASLAACYESNSEDPAPPPISITGGDSLPAGNPANGKIFYTQNCSICHAAGSDDTTRAFGAIDLANQGSRISSDISHFDKTYNLMSRFVDLDQQRVDDLKQYLAGL